MPWAVSVSALRRFEVPLRVVLLKFLVGENGIGYVIGCHEGAVFIAVLKLGGTTSV